MKILKRMTAALLALVMVVTMVPLSALATETKSVTVPEETAPVGEVSLDVPETVETETVETVPETAPATEPAEPTPEAAVPEETWEIGDIEVEETAETVASGEVVASGTCGDNLTWTLSADGVLTISGEGDMYNYYFDKYGGGRAPWHKLLESITSVVLRNGVTSIGKYAFYDCASLSSITIPNSVTSIGVGAFRDCDSLSSITIPDSVTSIDDYAFQYCISLNGITIPDSVTSIGSAAFSYCASLSSVTIGNSVTSLGSGAFRDCDSLSSITIPNNVTSIDDGAFSGCDSLSSITIPDSITSIGTWAFGNCASLSSITIPDSVTSIGYRAFSNCASLSSITIPDRVTSISEYVFYDCTSLSSVTIGNSVTSIGRCAFENCASLSSITIQDSVTTIEGYAFAECNKLKDVYYGGSQEQWNDIVCGTGNKVLQSAKIHFETGEVSDETVPEETEAPTTEPEETVPSTTEPEETEPEPIGGYIGENMNWSLADGVLTISGVGKMMSYGHYNPPWNKMKEEINSVIIGDGITNIGDCAFSGCVNLTSVAIPYSVTDIGYQAFKGCTSLPGATIPNSVATIGQYAFAGCKSMTSFVIPEGVTRIEYGLLSGCRSLTSVMLPDGITEILNYAFENCEALPAITVPDSVISIGQGVFSGCTGLVDVLLPDSLRYIGKSAFWYCQSLPGIIIPDSVEQIGENAFDSCKNLVSITIPGRVTKIASSTFAYCESLHSVTIPDSVTTIQYHAFIICKNLKDVYYGGSKEQWENIEFTYYMNDHGNKNLLNANIHYNESAVLNDYYRLKVTPEETTYTVFSGRKLELTFSLTCNDFQVKEWDHPIVSFREMDILEIKEWEQDGNKWALTLSAEKVGREFMTVTDIKSGRYLKMWVEVLPGKELDAADYLAFSSLAYRDYDKNCIDQSIKNMLAKEWNSKWDETNIKYSELCADIAEWTVCTYSENVNNGFFAVAFKNDANEVVIAYRGSKPINHWYDLILDTQVQNDWLVNDLPMILINEVWEKNQCGDAFFMYENIINNYKPSDVVVTGHSLGGGLGNLVSARYGCRAETVNAISMLDVFYFKAPSLLGEKFEGVECWNIRDHANEYDLLAGVYETLFKTRVKPYVSYKSLYDIASVAKNHSLSSYVIKDSTGKITLTETVNQFKPTDPISKEIPLVVSKELYMIDLGTASKNQFSAGLFEQISRSSYGGNGDDEINTSIWADSLIGGKGKDKLDGGWGNDAYFYYKGNGIDTIYDVDGVDELYLFGFSESDEIEVNADKNPDFIQITCNGEEILQIYKNNRSYSMVSFDKFTIYKDVGGYILNEYNITELFKEKKYHERLLIACPVNVEVLDTEGNVVYTLADGVSGSVYTDYGNFYVFQEESGSYGKILDLVEGYSARIVGTDSGIMNITRWKVDDGQLGDAQTLSDIPVSAGFVATVEENENGGIQINAEDPHAYQLGDVNHDTKINAKDATLILQKSVGVLKETAKFCEDCAEVSGDGKLNAKDSTLILQFSVGLRQDFPAQK